MINNHLIEKSGDPPIISTKLGKWVRNLDPLSPHFEKQREYAIEVLNSFLAIKLLHYYVAEYITALTNNVIAELNNKHVKDFPTDPKELYEYISNNSRLQQRIGIYTYQLSPLENPGEFLATMMLHCGINPNHLMPTVGSHLPIQSVMEVIGKMKSFAPTGGVIPGIIVGLPGSGKSTLAKKLGVSALITMPEDSIADFGQQPDMLETIILPYVGNEYMRHLRIPGEYNSSVIIDSEELREIQDEPSDHTATTFEQLLGYIVLNTSRGFDYFTKVMKLAGPNINVVPVGGIFQIAAYISASAGEDSLRPDTLQLLSLMPWQPSKVIELRPPPEVRQAWLAKDNAEAKRGQAVQVDEKIATCLESLREIFGDKYVVVDPTSPDIESQVADLVAPEGNIIHTIVGELGMILAPLTQVLDLALQMHIDPNNYTQHDLLMANVTEEPRFKGMAVNTLYTLKLLVDFYNKDKNIGRLLLLTLTDTFSDQLPLFELGLRALTLYIHSHFLQKVKVADDIPVSVELLTYLTKLGELKDAEVRHNIRYPELITIINVGKEIEVDTLFILLMEYLTNAEYRREFAAQNIDTKDSRRGMKNRKLRYAV